MDVGQSLVVRSKNDPPHRFNPYQRVTSQTRVVSSPSLVRLCKEEPKTTFEGTHGFYNDPPRPLDGISPPMTKSTDTNLPHLSKHPFFRWGPLTSPSDGSVIHSSAKFNCEPFQYSQHTSPTQFPQAKEAKKAAIAETNAKLRQLRRHLQCAKVSDPVRIAHLRKEHELLLRWMMQFDGRSGASREFNELQSETDSDAMTQPSFLHKLKTLSEVEPILSFINIRLRWVAAHGTKNEFRRLEIHKQRARKYRQEVDNQNYYGHRRRCDIIPTTQSGMDREESLQVLTNNAGPMMEKYDPHVGSQDNTEAMADLISQVSRLTRKVNNIQRSISSGKKGDTTEGLGIALLVTVQELLDRTKALAGKSADHRAAGKDTDV
ncbi:MAG: hypothetical protein Q9188_006979 [Gyalolechia gomerana]